MKGKKCDLFRYRRPTSAAFAVRRGLPIYRNAKPLAVLASPSSGPVSVGDGLREVSAYGFEFLWSVDRYNDHSINLYWVAVGMVGMIGAIIGAAIIYTVQMMRR